MIRMLPVFNLLVLLATAVLIPVFSKRVFTKIKQISTVAMLFATVSSVISLAYVVQIEGYSIVFGGYTSAIGIELTIDAFSALFAVFISALAFLIIVYSFADITHEIDEDQYGSYYTLVFILLFAMMGMTYTNDLFNMYVFMEILSLTSCAIISIKRKKANYLAALRYLVLNTIGSLSVLMGIALIYMVSGHLNMGQISLIIRDIWQLYPGNIVVALGFILTGLSIKAAVFPLHVWLPDAHSNAPTPSSALLSSIVVKVYVIATIKLLFKVVGADIVTSLQIPPVITIVAALGMIMGSIFAIGQKDIKRMLAYSSVAQIGYIFLGIGLMSEQGLSAALFHVISHGFMKSALFLSAGAIIYYKNRRNIKLFDGLGYQMPVTMIIFSFAALGMVGIPGFSGFMSKFYLLVAILEAGVPFYLGVILVSSYLNAVYYLPIIISAFLKEDKEGVRTMKVEKLPKSMLVPLIIIGVVIVSIGFYPQLIMQFIELAVATLIN